MTESPAPTSTKPPVWKIWTWKLHWQILFSLLVGAGVGLAWAFLMYKLGPAEGKATLAQQGAVFGLDVMKLIGDLFLNGLKLVVVPLVVSSIAVSYTHLRAHET